MHSVSKFKKGFTLLELLIAASIVAMLLMFATVSYRNSITETRIEGAKAKLKMLASAYQRFMIENPGWYINEAAVNEANVPACPLGKSGVNPANYGGSILISCGYLEKQGWGEDSYFTYTVYKAASSTANIACMSARDINKIPAKFHGKLYCVKKNGEVYDEFKDL